MANDTYLKLITSQYQNKTKFMSWLTENLNKIDGCYVATQELDSNFDVDSANGIQLDVLGLVVGVDRLLPFEPSDGSSPLLDDATYRILIKAKIAQNHWDGTIPELYNIWNLSFPSIPIKIQDNQDMTFTVLFVSQSYTALQRELISSGYIMPKPEGVGVTYNFNGTFSFASDSASESDASAGFADIAETTGGYLGAVG
jgi:hypothetical protein